MQRPIKVGKSEEKKPLGRPRRRYDKVVPVLSLTEHHAMKAYWGVEV
jgi:hypothetical protein